MPDPTYKTVDRPLFGADASVAVTAAQLAKISGSGTVAPTTAITDVPCGQVLADASSGADVAVHGLVGVVELIGSAAVSAGQTVEPSTTAGQVKPFTTGVKVGVALDTFAGSPLRGRVVITPIAVS